uniref:Uncharacterized protein n=1 Tax=Meloidogyne incognita TaxID=6306 RepID=A0A914KYN9_MELIC
MNFQCFKAKGYPESGSWKGSCLKAFKNKKKEPFIFAIFLMCQLRRRPRFHLRILLIVNFRTVRSSLRLMLLLSLNRRYRPTQFA